MCICVPRVPERTKLCLCGKRDRGRCAREAIDAQDPAAVSDTEAHLLSGGQYDFLFCPGSGITAK